MAASSLGINMNTMGVFYQPIADDLGLYVGTVAFQTTMAAIFLAIIGTFVHRILSWFRFRQMAVFGAILAGLSIASISLVSSPFLFNLLGVLRGIGSGLISVVPFTLLINNWFEEKNGLALSIATSFAGVVGVILSPVLTWCISQFGWRTSAVIMGALFILFNLPILLMGVRLNPRDEGLLAYGETSLPDRDLVEDDPVKLTPNRPFNYTSPLFLSLVFIAFFYPLSTGLSQNLPGFALSKGFDLEFGASLLSAAMLSNILFKLILGPLANKIGPTKTTIYSALVLVLAYGILLTSQHTGLLLVGAFLYGICYFVPPLALPLLTNQFFGKAQANRIYPFISLLTGLSGAFSISAIGYVYDFTQSYEIAILVLVVVTGLSIALLIYCLRQLKDQDKV